jgi:quinol-cytochrome oxidoreductase complex cytochrome b subunit
VPTSSAILYGLNCELALWFRSIVAWIIALILLVALIAYIDREAVTEPLREWFQIALGSIVIWLIFGPAWSLVFFRRTVSPR